jgi:hypothetical protein
MKKLAHSGKDLPFSAKSSEQLKRAQPFFSTAA